MASLRVHPDRLEIHLTPAEKTLAFRRENVVIARENIRSVTITDDPWIWVRGIRSPGALVPLVVAVGVWKFHGGKDFLAIKRRRQAVVIDLTGDDFARVVLSTNHAPDLIASLKLDADAAPAAAIDAEKAAETAGGAQPNDPATAAKPAKRARAAKVATPVEVTDPAAPAAGVKPARRARTAKVVTAGEVGEVVAQPAEPADPTDPAQAARPARPKTRSKRTTATAQPAESTEPAAPAKPAKRASRATVTPVAQTAADAVNPAAEPVDPEKPAESDKPAE